MREVSSEGHEPTRHAQKREFRNTLAREKFNDLVFAINLAEVKRESLNPDNPYFAHLSSRKKERARGHETLS